MAEEEIHTPHDAMVRAILDRKTSAISYLRDQLPPELVQRLDWPGLKRLSGSYVTGEMRMLHSDFVFEVPFEDRPLFLYCLLEHQSRVEALMRFRLLGYLVNFLTQWLRDHPGARALPPVIPLVLYAGREPWSVSCRMIDLFALPADLREALAPWQPDFEHLLLDLSRMEMEQIGGEIVSRTMLMLLKAAAEGAMEQWLDAHAGYLKEVLAQENGREVLSVFLRYICRAGAGTTYSTVEEKLARLKSPQIKEEMMTIADELMQKGRQEGRQEGHQEGRQEGLLIGSIQTLERLLGSDVSATAALAAKSVDELKENEAVLLQKVQDRRG